MTASAARTLRNQGTRRRRRGATHLELLLLLGVAAAGAGAFAQLGGAFHSAIGGAGAESTPSRGFALPAPAPAVAPSAQAGVAHAVGKTAELLAHRAPRVDVGALESALHAAEPEQASRIGQWMDRGWHITQDANATIARLNDDGLKGEWAAVQKRHPELHYTGPKLDLDNATSVLSQMDEGILKVHALRRKMLARAVEAGVFPGRNTTTKYVLHQLERLDEGDPTLARYIDRLVADVSMENGFSGMGPIDSSVGFAIRPSKFSGEATTGPLALRAASLWTGRDNAKVLLRLTRPDINEGSLDAIIDALPSQQGRGDYDDFGAVHSAANTGTWARAMGGGFAAPGPMRAAHSIDEYSRVLEQAASLFNRAERRNPAAPRSVSMAELRTLAQPTLKVMGERIHARFLQLDAAEEASLIDRSTAETFREAARKAEAEVRRAENARALSFGELHELVDDFLLITKHDLNANGEIIRGQRHATSDALGYVGGRWFPILSDEKFWSYDRVWDWRHSFGDMFGVEIPVGTKGQYADPDAFLTHDAGHVGFAGATTYDSENRPVWRRLVAAYDAIEARGEVPAEVKLALGNYLWEGGLDLVMEQLIGNEALATTKSIRARGELRDILPDELIHFGDRSIELLGELRDALAD